MLMSCTVYTTNLEGKQFSDAEVKMPAKKEKVYQTIFIRVALNFMPHLRMLSAFQFQTSSRASLN